MPLRACMCVGTMLTPRDRTTTDPCAGAPIWSPISRGDRSGAIFIPRVRRAGQGARRQTSAVTSSSPIPVDVVASWSLGLPDVIALLGAVGTILVAWFALVQTQRLAIAESNERARSRQ